MGTNDQKRAPGRRRSLGGAVKGRVRHKRNRAGQCARGAAPGAQWAPHVSGAHVHAETAQYTPTLGMPSCSGVVKGIKLRACWWVNCGCSAEVLPSYSAASAGISTRCGLNTRERLNLPLHFSPTALTPAGAALLSRYRVIRLTTLSVRTCCTRSSAGW